VNTTQRLAELKGELSTFKMDFSQLVARIREHETQIALLSAGTKTRVSSLPRTEAILAILRMTK